MIKNRTLLTAVLTIVHFHRTACGNEIIMKLSNPSKRWFLTSDSKKLTLNAVLYHYCIECQFFWIRRYQDKPGFAVVTFKANFIKSILVCQGGFKWGLFLINFYAVVVFWIEPTSKWFTFNILGFTFVH